MEKGKQAEFVRKMRKKRLSLTKRQNFDIGGIAGLLGIGGGNLGGTGFSTNPGATPDQIAQSYHDNQNLLNNQEGLANTLNPQAASAVNAQNTLSGQYAQQALGQGPNVAQTMLNTSTGNNIAGQAALMAGQRGAAANPALLARQAAQQGASTQQQAAGQAATLQAQQQIAAQQAQAGLASNQIAQSQGATNAATQAGQGEQGILQGANAQQNQIQGQLAGNTLANQQKLTGGVLNAGGGALESLLYEGGEIHGPKKLDFIHKMAKLGMEHFHGPEKMADGGLTVMPQQQYQAPQMMLNNNVPQYGGISSSAPSIEDPKKKADKAKPDPMEGAQEIGPVGSADLINPLGSAAPSMLTMAAYEGGEMHPPEFQGPHKSHIANYLMNAGGKVPALVSPGEIKLTPEQVKQVVKNNVDPAKIGMKYGGKAKVKGDSKKNDVIPDDLEDGDVIVDRDHMMTPEKRKLFVRKAIDKKKVGGK